MSPKDTKCKLIELSEQTSATEASNNGRRRVTTNKVPKAVQRCLCPTLEHSPRHSAACWLKNMRQLDSACGRTECLQKLLYAQKT